MAVADYITKEQLKATLELTGTVYADEDIAAAVTSASRWIDDYCGRRFYPDDDANQVRYYTPVAYDRVYIDDLITLTSVATDDGVAGTYTTTWALGTDYVLEPRSPTSGYPYTAIRRLPGGTYRWSIAFPETVMVTGKWGWTAPPAQIKEATTILASRLLRRTREAPFGVLTIGVDVGSVARLPGIDQDVRSLVNPFRRWRAGV